MTDPNAGAVLLDTCAVIWLMNGDNMSSKSRQAIHAALTANKGVFVSAITAWEVGTLVTRKRLQLTMPAETWIETLMSRPGVRLASLAPKILIASCNMPDCDLRDPADRMIAASAREHGFTLITRDQRLLAYAKAGHLKAIKC